VKVALIDYGAGNLRSVANALKALGQEPAVVANAAQLGDATHLLLPGVGSFGDCMAQLEERGLANLIRDW
jgi:glutamine amidotransferase